MVYKGNAENKEPRTCDLCENTQSYHLTQPIAKRVWNETISPAYMHEKLGIYNGVWMPLMDRCWESTDGYQVMSRLVRTEYGRVEHAVIIRVESGANKFSSNGSRDIPWSEKQKIKNELFGENRLAIEVFPKAKDLVDVMDVYHLWVFDKDYKLPFGIHPTRDRLGTPVARGYNGNIEILLKNTEYMQNLRNGGKSDESV